MPTKSSSALVPSTGVPATPGVPMRPLMTDGQIARSFLSVIVTGFLAVAIVVDLSQLLLAADGNITAIRLMVTAALLIGCGLPMAQRRMRSVSFTILASGAAIVIIVAGLFALSAHPPH